MRTVAVSVVNSSTAVTDDDCRKLTAALQTQVSRDFAPIWGIDAKLTFLPKTPDPGDNTWWLSILDNTDRAHVLGYHELTPDGLPHGKVFAGTDIHYGLNWTVTASHELLEMLVNPDLGLMVIQHTSDGKAHLFEFEVCDPCEDESLAYDIDGTMVCDFVYPAYFETFRVPAQTQFDHRSMVKGPVPTIAQGGYLNSFDIGNWTGWQQVTAAEMLPGNRPGKRPGKRNEARSHGWMSNRHERRLLRGAPSTSTTKSG